MCLQHNRVALTPQHCYRGKATMFSTMSSFGIIVYFHVAVKTTEQLIAAIQAQE
jgi:hypothetical protein